MMRIGELVLSQHTIKACNIHVAKNKDKFLIVLYSSKTHSKANYPQQIKITSNNSLPKPIAYFCPFATVRDYLKVRRPGFLMEQENLFIFSDGSPVVPHHVRLVLKSCLSQLNLDSNLYNTMSFRSGRASDLLKAGVLVDRIKHLGRWRSNAVYKYLKY